MSTFLVTNIQDSGSGSLRQAIINTNNNPGADIINFDTSTGSPFSDNNPDLITLSSGELKILDHVTINGTGVSLLFLSGNNSNRVFNIDDGLSFIQHLVTINNLGIVQGKAIVGNLLDPSVNGGGILNHENLTLNNCLVSENSILTIIVPGKGGGIFNDGILAINNSTISNNYSLEKGGGISNDGVATIKNSTITGNQVGQEGDYGSGGGIDNSGTLTIENTKVSNNLGTNGSGIYNTAITEFLNGEISGNASFHGGSGTGIKNSNSLSILSITDSTISNNFGILDILGYLGNQGGGISNDGQATIKNSNISNNRGSSGGGIENKGDLIITDSQISGNYAFSDGGGIESIDSTLLIQHSTISNNQSDRWGGGISAWTGSDIKLIDCIVSHNQAVSNGGGVYIDDQSTGNIIGSNVSENKTIFAGSIYDSQGGGGIYTDGELLVVNSTISGNKSVEDGAGLLNLGELSIFNSTFSNNQAQRFGGGIFNKSTLTIANSIVANSVAQDVYNHTSGTLNLLGNNLVEDGSIGGVLTGDPNLSPLQNNGGFTPTHALLSGSLAINGGNNTFVPVDTEDLDEDGNTTEQIPFDQRGVGFVRINGGTVDIGAFETQSITPNLDIDGNGICQGSTDGILIARYLFGFSGDTLINGVVAPNATRTMAEEIQNYLFNGLPDGNLPHNEMLDVDGNGIAQGSTDGILIARYLFGFSGDTLINGVIGSGATRTTANEIETFLDSFII
jgi:hypothetical protein